MQAIDFWEKYKNYNQENPDKDNEDLLLMAFESVQREIVQSNYSIDAVRLGHEIYGYLGDRGLQMRVDLTRRYLKKGSIESLNDLFWANWEMVDNLALLKSYEEMIEEQVAFLEWSKENLGPEYWIKVMYDSTQAVGWFHENRMDDWFEIYQELLTKIHPSESNRHSRILLVETASGLCAYERKDYDRALKEIGKYHDILTEDEKWHDYDKFYIRYVTYLLETYLGKKEMDKYDALINDTIFKIENKFGQYEKGLSDNIDEVCDMSHDIATSLMWEKRYEQAMKLFEKAIEYQGTGVTHFFYAICIWAQNKDREETLHHLRMAENKITGNGGLRSRYIHMFLEQPEFIDVREDEEFLSVFNHVPVGGGL
ncbi:tetratricopeptide (TPR) repeat protein [Bacillus tianshenii]|uniref:Tetratricopeptide (TPR) repeat protein n=1 Tax=Sutcliffiella tianshenii TaxID=1463404 RepID=A0ABS2NXJ8_9BACI|nr:hypothetical protein [Bacillus tianshenii]MBM7619344.1 tetratricopeptide (TPR) repeat protein [Bacillus tianshenii]